MTEANTSSPNRQQPQKKRNTCRQFLFLTDILPRLYRRSQRRKDQQPRRNPRRISNILRFYPISLYPFIKGVSEVLRRCLQQGVRIVFKSDTTLRSHLVRPKDVLDSRKQDVAVYKIPCECGKVYIRETGRATHERIKEHDRDIRLARTQASAVSEHANKTRHFPIWNEVVFIDWYTRRLKKAIHIRLQPNNNRESGIEIPEAWMSTIKKHSSRTCEGTKSIRNNNEDRNTPIATNQRTNVLHRRHVIKQPNRLMKTSSDSSRNAQSISQSDSIMRQTSKHLPIVRAAINNNQIFNNL